MNFKILFLTLLLMFGTLIAKPEEKLIQDRFPNPNGLTKQELYEQIIKFGIKFPDIVFAQAILESGSFTSSLFRTSNNLFGMRYPRQRETTAKGKTKSGYSRYEDWNFSVYDYFLWQDHMFKKRGELSKSEYFALLGRVYAKDPRYVAKVKQKITEHKHIFR